MAFDRAFLSNHALNKNDPIERKKEGVFVWIVCVTYFLLRNLIWIKKNLIQWVMCPLTNGKWRNTIGPGVEQCKYHQKVRGKVGLMRV